jgi:hypothetical protein
MKPPNSQRLEIRHIVLLRQEKQASKDVGVELVASNEIEGVEELDEGKGDEVGFGEV